MNKNYSPQDFFACVPNTFLKQYFDNRHVMQDIDFESKDDDDFNKKILASWAALDEVQRNDMETHFQEIHALSNEKGMNALIDEALFHEEALNDTFEENELVGFEARAFWAFLNRETLWKNALSLNYADAIPFASWKRRSELGDYPAKVDEQSVQRFTKALADYFGNDLYMGKNCQVECLKRVVNDKTYDYFFAYPEDYARVFRNWESGKTKNQVQRKALEVIFVYCKEQHALDIWCQFYASVVKDLQKIFANEILGIELTKPVKVKKEYELDAFKQSMPNLIFSPQTGIESIRVNKLRITMSHSKDKITLEANTHDDNAVYKLFDKLKNSVSGEVMNITQVGLIAQFVPAENGKPQTRKFLITYPNDCNLKFTAQDEILRQVLIDSGIQPKPVTKVTDKQ